MTALSYGSLAAAPAITVAVVVGVLILGVAAIALVIKNLLHVCQPNEVLVFSGRSRRLLDGTLKGYRVVRGGRALRVPLLEIVDRMDLTNMIIELTVRNAYSRGGIPLTVQGIANIKIPGEEPLLSNALERFLGRSRPEIMQIARETLEGNLRGVMASLTPEEVNRDKERFATQLATEAEQDFDRLGLVLDTLKIQNVSDEVGYLESIGRARSARIRRDAQVAEAEAKAEAEEQKWHNTMNAELAKLNAAIQIAIKENDRRIADARSRREALIAAERGQVQAHLAQVTADIQTQDARIEQVRLKLQADVIEPAEARCRQEQEAAKGEAARLIEQGRATAQVLSELAVATRDGGEAGREVLLLQKLLPLFHQFAATLGHLKVDRLTVLGTGKAGGDLGTALVAYGEQIRTATGIDVAKLLRDRTAVRPPPPPRPPG